MDENSYQFFDNVCVLYIISGFGGCKRNKAYIKKKRKKTKPGKILLKIFARLSVTRSRFKIYVITEFGGCDCRRFFVFLIIFFGIE